MDFNMKLKGFRIAKGLTQKELSVLVGVTPQMISGMETGTKEPNLKTLINLAKSLGVTPNDLCGFVSADGKEL